MPSLQLIFQIIAGLGPYFSIAVMLAVMIGLFLPWGIVNPEKWLFFYAIGLCLLPFGGSNPDSEGSLYKQVTWGALYTLCFIIISRSSRDNSSPKINFPIELIALYIFILLTITWSEYKLSSFKRYILLVGLFLIAIISSKLSLRDRSFSSLIEKPVAFFMLCGAAFAAAFPGKAFDADGALLAYTSHKNTWGQFLSLCSIIFFSNILSKKGRLLYIPLLAISLVMLYMSKSATSLLAFAFSSSFLLLMKGFSSKNMAGKLLVLAFFLSSAVATLIYCIAQGRLPFDTLTDLVFKVTEKSSTLSGRTFLWQLMGAEIARHPWLGTGFGGFWVGLEGAAGTLVKRLDWGPPTQAHSGYLDVANEIGIIGLLILSTVLLTHLYRCFSLYRADTREHFSIHASMMTSFLILNYAESSFIQGTNIWWIVILCSIIEVFNRTQAVKENTPGRAGNGSKIRHVSRSLKPS